MDMPMVVRGWHQIWYSCSFRLLKQSWRHFHHPCAMQPFRHNEQAACAAAPSAFSFLLVLATSLFLWQAPANAAPGNVLPGFGTGGTYVLPLSSANDDQLFMTHVVAQQDGRIIVAGYNPFETVLVGLTGTGTLDTTYGVAGVVRIASGSRRSFSRAMLQPDGKLLVALHDTVGGKLIRLSTLGVVDPTFGMSGTVTTTMSPYALAIAPDSKILIGGQTVLSRLQANGALDNTFGVNGLMQLPSNVVPRSIAVDADLSIVAAGEGMAGRVPRRQRIARILSNGSVDQQFGISGVADAILPVGYGGVNTLKIVIDTSRRILVAGEVELNCGGAFCSNVIVHRLLSQGTLDSTFGNTGMTALGTSTSVLIARDIAIQPGGDILVGANGVLGSVFTNTMSETIIARLLSNGTLDPGFGIGGFSQRDLTTRPHCYISNSAGEVAILPSGVAFTVGHWEEGSGICGVGKAAVSSFLLRDANDDAQPEPWDVTPDTLFFADAVNALPNTPTVSGLATVQGLDAGVSVPVGATGGELTLNGSTVYSTSAWVANGDQVNVRQQSSATSGASVTMQIVAGGVQPANNVPFALGGRATSTFTTTTRAALPGTLALTATTASVTENAGSITLSVARTGGSAGTIGVTFGTSGNTAQSPSDFTATTGTLSWADGDTANKTIVIPIINDTAFESAESFTLVLSSPTGGASLGNTTETITINDDDPAGSPGQLTLSSTLLSVAESVGSVTLSVTRSGGTMGAVSVSYATANGSAGAGADFTATSGTLAWADGDGTAKTIMIPIANDTVNEPTKSFTVTLSAATGGAAIIAGSAIISIIDDDAATPPPVTPPASSDGGGGGALRVDALLALLVLLGLRFLRRRIARADPLAT